MQIFDWNAYFCYKMIVCCVEMNFDRYFDQTSESAISKIVLDLSTDNKFLNCTYREIEKNRNEWSIPKKNPISQFW